jgi:hypothetical protein
VRFWWTTEEERSSLRAAEGVVITMPDRMTCPELAGDDSSRDGVIIGLAAGGERDIHAHVSLFIMLIRCMACQG